MNCSGFIIHTHTKLLSMTMAIIQIPYGIRFKAVSTMDFDWKFWTLNIVGHGIEYNRNFINNIVN